MPDKNFCRLGNISFSAEDGITGFSSETGYDYAKHDLAAGKPTLQAIGEKLQELNINIMLRNFLGHDVAKTIEALEALQASGAPQKLVFGSGIYQGQFVIQGITAQVIKTDVAGIIQSATLSLSLVEYADNEKQAVRKTEAKALGIRPIRNVIIQ